MEASKPILAAHPVNAKRIAEGKKPATQIWLWGQGKAPRMAPFADVYGGRGAIISAVDLVRGVGVLLGWHRIDVPSASGYLDTNYTNKGKYAVEAARVVRSGCAFTSKPPTKPLTRERQTGKVKRALEPSTSTSSDRFWRRTPAIPATTAC